MIQGTPARGAEIPGGPYIPLVGTFHVDVEIGNLQGQRFERVRALVDCGSTYMRVPHDLLERLGVQPQEQRTFEMADGRRVEYGVGQAQVRLGGLTRYNVVVFGETESAPLLGAITLEAFGLGVDTVNQRLVPVMGLMM